MTWINVEDKLPKPFETVWLSNGINWVALGCRVDTTYEGWFWAQSNGIIYQDKNQIVAECEGEDLDVKFWHSVPDAPYVPKEG